MKWTRLAVNKGANRKKSLGEVELCTRMQALRAGLMTSRRLLPCYFDESCIARAVYLFAIGTLVLQASRYTRVGRGKGSSNSIPRTSPPALSHLISLAGCSSLSVRVSPCLLAPSTISMKDDLRRDEAAAGMASMLSNRPSMSISVDPLS